MGNEISPRPERPSLIHRIFIGKQGIRAGWSIGIFVIISAVLSFAALFCVRFIIQGMHPTVNGVLPPAPLAIREFGLFLALLAASIIMTRIEHKPIISYGFEGEHRLRYFIYGFLFGFIALSALVGAMMLLGFIRFDGVHLYGWGILRYAVVWGGVFVIVGLYEEYLLRGYLQATLSRGIGVWWSAIILSIAFGSLHLFNPGESRIGIISVVEVGLVLCLSLWYLKTLWWAIGFHVAWDWAESYFWGTADSGLVMKGHLFDVQPHGNILWSGGATGPEGSLLVIVLLLIVAALMWITWHKKTTATDLSGGTTVP